MKNKKILSLIACLSLLSSCNKGTTSNSSCSITTSTPNSSVTPEEKIDITKYIKAYTNSGEDTLYFAGFTNDLTDEMKLKVKEFELPSEINGKKITKLTISSFYQFKGFDNLEIIKFSKDIQSIYYYSSSYGTPFAYLPSLKSIVVDKDNANYYTEGNCLISKSDKEIVTGWGNVVIPNDITKIRNYAFAECLSVTSVKLHPNVNEIGVSSFRKTNISDIDLNGNTNFIKKIDIVNGKENYIIYKDSNVYFAKGDDLTIDIPELASTLNLYSFKFIKNVTIGENIISLPSSALRGTNIETVSLPKTLTLINDYAFCNMDKLKEIKLSSENNTLKLAGNCLYEKRTAGYVIHAAYGEVIMPDEITNGHFQYKTSITSLKLNAKIKDINWNSFSWSNYDTSNNIDKKLEDYYLISVDENNPNIKATKNGRGLINIETKTLIYAIPDLDGNLIVDDDVEIFGLSGINNVVNPKYIKSITLNEGLKKIEPVMNYSFCYSGKIELENLTLPSTLVEMTCAEYGYNFFSNFKINSLSIRGGNNEHFQIIDNCLIYKGGNKDGSDQYVFGIKDLVIPESITRLSESTFYKNYSLTSITFHKNLTYIEVKNNTATYGLFRELSSDVKTIKFLGTLDEFKKEIDKNEKREKTTLYAELKKIDYQYKLIVLDNEGKEVSYNFPEI